MFSHDLILVQTAGEERHLQTCSGLPDKLKPPEILQTHLSEERARVLRRTDGFNWKKSPVWRHLSYYYGPKVKQEELVSIADLICEKVNLKLDRDARRRKIVMIKWFEEHWQQIQPLLHMIVLEN